MLAIKDKTIVEFYELCPNNTSVILDWSTEKYPIDLDVSVNWWIMWGKMKTKNWIIKLKEWVIIYKHKDGEVCFSPSEEVFYKDFKFLAFSVLSINSIQ